ncbi:hypothetical protein P171DRAFT_252111 [Karstenula rhodostoma CBS 690.94]|uniref:Uncharacterized protein n=1 Tax=Karstenula rhodostoma CBS 690.94 TaxID=1392251 RepID=A0A9P4PMN5_9PLEO|nr:hypothetical protein P171DRAFT_252111 [Karstenula rhodostoma CBS 690.94]
MPVGRPVRRSRHASHGPRVKAVVGACRCRQRQPRTLNAPSAARRVSRITRNANDQNVSQVFFFREGGTPPSGHASSETRRACQEQAGIDTLLPLRRNAAVSLRLPLPQRLDPAVEPIRTHAAAPQCRHAAFALGQPAGADDAVCVRAVLRGTVKGHHGPVLDLPALHCGRRGGGVGFWRRGQCHGVRAGDGLSVTWRLALAALSRFRLGQRTGKASRKAERWFAAAIESLASSVRL